MSNTRKLLDDQTIQNTTIVAAGNTYDYSSTFGGQGWLPTAGGLTSISGKFVVPTAHSPGNSGVAKVQIEIGEMDYNPNGGYHNPVDNLAGVIITTNGATETVAPFYESYTSGAPQNSTLVIGVPGLTIAVGDTVKITVSATLGASNYALKFADVTTGVTKDISVALPPNATWQGQLGLEGASPQYGAAFSDFNPVNFSALAITQSGGGNTWGSFDGDVKDINGVALTSHVDHSYGPTVTYIGQQ